ncbi:MAG: hypothetical protein HYY03_07335 [Chloroflexi bacterium]|nr:hypothetical protein [Chloroflexota bacterium]
MEPRSRSSRRRRPQPASPEPAPARSLLRRRELLLVVGLAAVVIAVVATVLLVSSGDEKSATEQPTQSADEAAIESLARRSIDVLPQGQWPSLYDSFTTEFQQRCPQADFAQVGADNAAQLGADLPFLRFKRLENVAVSADNARAVIVGEVVGRNEYRIQAAFQKQDGAWKLAPAPDTEGCDAFTRLGG